MAIKQKLWALGWLSANNRDCPPIAECGAWAFFHTKGLAEAARSEPDQDLQHVEVTVEVIPERAKRKPVRSATS